MHVAFVNSVGEEACHSQQNPGKATVHVEGGKGRGPCGKVCAPAINLLPNLCSQQDLDKKE